ncbi:DUF6049 family protein [Corynebacterium caspium]|uniref:DUF6049 family protein n=1 Tax=Corynebacterium caspium TaxID=234828 RepID=UPI0003A258D1|nr:DUF6049 family protein [Corynebacterium caspium]WKD60055.1 hypothetical protein CCASP_08415 [Corynebacterium caspium DSM 44850]
MTRKLMKGQEMKRSLAATLRVSLLCAICGILGVSSPIAQAAPPFPQSPTHPDYAEVWVNPLVRAGEETGEHKLSVELTAISSQIQVDETLTVTLSVRNNTNETIHGVQITPRRANAVPDVAAARLALAQDLTAFTTVGATTNLGDLAPGGQHTLALDLSPDGPLQFGAAGTYPLLFATTAAENATGGQLINTERTLIRVENTPSEVTASGAGAGEAGSNRAQAGAQAGASQAVTNPGITALYPLTENTGVVPGELGDAPARPELILRDNQLGESLSPGGRLYGLLDSYIAATTANPAVGQASCLAIDPAVLDTVERMSHGYSVGADRLAIQQEPRRLRDSWTIRKRHPQFEKGYSVTEASAWLARLREVAQDHCTVALPWAQADLNAVARTGNRWLMREAIERGQYILRDILGVAPTTGVILPATGYMDTGVASLLSELGNTAATNISGNMDAAKNIDPIDLAWEQSDGDVSRETLQNLSPFKVLVADNSLGNLAGTGHIFDAAPGVEAISFNASLAATLATTGLAPETTAYSNQDARFDYRLDSAGARAATASNAFSLAVDNATTATNPLIVVPPGSWDIASARQLLQDLERATTKLQPLNLKDALIPNAQATKLTDPNPTGAKPQFGSPYSDPGAFSDIEIQPAAQQAKIIDDITLLMRNENSIALRRYGFSAPIRRDILNALSANGRTSNTNFDTAVRDSKRRIGQLRESIRGLRTSVALIPPGNVVTRASASSPLLIVARNGLPLPVRATIKEAEIAAPRPYIDIPARGSITVQFTPELQTEDDFTLTLWLANSKGIQISDPVKLSVQTRARVIITFATVAVMVIALALAIIFRVGKARRN